MSTASRKQAAQVAEENTALRERLQRIGQWCPAHGPHYKSPQNSSESAAASSL